MFFLLSALYPTFFNVTLHPPVVEEEFVQFYCEVSRHDNLTVSKKDDGSRFLVNFYFDHVLQPNASLVIKSPNTRVAMDEQWLRGNLGKSVRKTDMLLFMA